MTSTNTVHQSITDQAVSAINRAADDFEYVAAVLRTNARIVAENPECGAQNVHLVQSALQAVIRGIGHNMSANNLLHAFTVLASSQAVVDAREQKV